MKVTLIPQGRSETLQVIKSGDVLIVNGEEFDLSLVGEGDTLPADAIASPWFWDKVERINGKLELSLFLPLPWNYSQEQLFPKPLLNVPDGVVALPPPLDEEQSQEKLADNPMLEQLFTGLEEQQ
jgi:hypothetical protein